MGKNIVIPQLDKPFNFVPKYVRIVFIIGTADSSKDISSADFVNPISFSSSPQLGIRENVTWNENTLNFYHTENANQQLNATYHTYAWIAFG